MPIRPLDPSLATVTIAAEGMAKMATRLTELEAENEHLRTALHHIHRDSSGESATRDPYGMLQRIMFTAEKALEQR